MATKTYKLLYHVDGMLRRRKFGRKTYSLWIKHMLQVMTIIQYPNNQWVEDTKKLKNWGN